MKKFEYKVISISTINNIEPDLLYYGKQGWELVAVLSSATLYNFTVIFKRELNPDGNQE